VQPDNITATLLQVLLHLVDMGPALELDEQGRPTAIFGRTVHEGCNRAGLAESGEFSQGHGEGRCLVKLGCKGPVAKCNVPIRGWTNGIGGCPNVGGICTACTMPGFPDKYLPLMDADAAARLYARTARIARGPLVSYLRDRRIRRSFDVEPEWRRPGSELTSGYRAA
jgi:hydrogenase small subunit